jgi:hypothetical protein
MLLSEREEEIFKCLTRAIESLVGEVHILHQQRTVEFEWFGNRNVGGSRWVTSDVITTH